MPSSTFLTGPSGQPDHNASDPDTVAVKDALAFMDGATAASWTCGRTSWGPDRSLPRPVIAWNARTCAQGQLPDPAPAMSPISSSTPSLAPWRTRPLRASPRRPGQTDAVGFAMVGTRRPEERRDERSWAAVRVGRRLGTRCDGHGLPILRFATMERAPVRHSLRGLAVRVTKSLG